MDIEEQDSLFEAFDRWQEEDKKVVLGDRLLNLFHDSFYPY